MTQLTVHRIHAARSRSVLLSTSVMTIQVDEPPDDPTEYAKRHGGHFTTIDRAGRKHHDEQS